MALFAQSAENLGVDEASNWMMVPVGGSNAVVLRGGAGLECSIKPGKGRVRVEEPHRQTTGTRVLTLHGLSRGKAVLRAVDKRGRVKARIDVSVKRKLRLGLGFYVVRGPGDADEQPVFNVSTVEAIVAGANKILGLQANIAIVMNHKALTVETSIDRVRSVPSEFLGPGLPTHSWDDMVALATRRSDFGNVFFVKHLDVAYGKMIFESRKGLTIDSAIALASNASVAAYARTLAHEVVHLLGMGSEHHEKSSRTALLGSVGSHMSKKLSERLNPG